MYNNLGWLRVPGLLLSSSSELSGRIERELGALTLLSRICGDIESDGDEHERE